ncbi:Calcium/calmodulin-dependent protein kinase kinase 1, partial [Kappamyces sp. JEL0680]
IETEKPVYKESLSKPIKDLLDGMLNKNPHRRLKMDAIKTHAWVTESGRRPLPSTKENCPVEQVTQEEIERLFKPTSLVYKVSPAGLTRQMMNIFGVSTKRDSHSSTESSKGGLSGSIDRLYSLKGSKRFSSQPL